MGPAGDFGWTGFDPLGQSRLVPYGGPQPWTKLVIWLALIAIWVAVSASVLGARKSGRDAWAPGRGVAVAGAGFSLYLIGSWMSGWNSYCGWAGCPGPRRVATYYHLEYPQLQWHPWQLLLIWLGFICVWLGIALWILRSRPIEQPSVSH